MFGRFLALGAIAMTLGTASFAETKMVHSVDSDGNVISIIFTDITAEVDYEVFVDFEDGLEPVLFQTTGIVPDTVDLRGDTFSVAPDGETLVLTNVETGQQFRSSPVATSDSSTTKRYGLD